MKLACVIGTVISTVKHPALDGKKLLLVQPLDDAAQLSGRAGLAIDSVGAGVGDTVLVVEEGTAAADIVGMDNPPVRTVIVGIVDRVDVLAQEPIAGVA